MLTGHGLQPKRARDQISPKQVKIIVKLNTSGHSSYFVLEGVNVSMIHVESHGRL